MTNTQNTVCLCFFFSFFFFFAGGDTKFICHYPFLMVADKIEIEYENEIALDRQRETNQPS